MELGNQAAGSQPHRVPLYSSTRRPTSLDVPLRPVCESVRSLVRFAVDGERGEVR
ncbi:hypothetical protein M3J09_011492 [Ascochyta lentis]